MIKHKPKEGGKTCLKTLWSHLLQQNPGPYAFEQQPVGGPHTNEFRLRTQELRLDKRHPLLEIGQMKSIVGLALNKAPPTY